MVPVTVDDLVANELLDIGDRPSWDRRGETLAARKESLQGLGLATLSSIAAFVLYRSADDGTIEIVSLRAADEDGESALGSLVDTVARRARGELRLPGAHADEVPSDWLEAWGFRAGRRVVRLGAAARAS